MSELVFIHDHIFFRRNDEYFSGGGLPFYIWHRYLNVFDTVTVIGREGKGDSKKLVKSSSEGVSFNLSVTYKSPLNYIFHKNKIREELEPVIIKHKQAVIRLPSVLGFIALEICTENKIPVLIEAVGSAYDSLKYSGIKGRLFGWFLEKKMKTALQNSLYSIYVTQNFLQNVYPTKGESINASNVMITNVRFETLERRISFIETDRSKIRLGIIGSLSVPYKGHKVLLKAFSELDKSLQSRCEICFVGGGKYEHIYKYAEYLGVESSVVFLGTLEAGGGVEEFIDSIDLCIQPSLTEGLPRVILEAFSRACPVLGSDAGGIPELLDPKFIHPAGNSKILSEHLSSYLMNKSVLKEMASANFERSKEFQEEYLNSKRTEFFKKFKNHYAF